LSGLPRIGLAVVGKKGDGQTHLGAGSPAESCLVKTCKGQRSFGLYLFGPAAAQALGTSAQLTASCHATSEQINEIHACTVEHWSLRKLAVHAANGLCLTHSHYPWVFTGPVGGILTAILRISYNAELPRVIGFACVQRVAIIYESLL